MLPIRPQQAYSFRCWFSQQPHLILPSKDAFNFIRGTSCHFLLCSFHSTLSILSGGFVSCLHQVSFHPLKLVFYSFHLQLECYLNPFSLIRVLSRSKWSGFIVYLIPWAFILVILVVPLFFLSALVFVHLLSCVLTSPLPLSLPSHS